MEEHNFNDDAYYDVIAHEDEAPSEQFCEEFYDACTLDDPNKKEQSTFSETHHETITEDLIEEQKDDPLTVRLELESTLSDDELKSRRDESVQLKEAGNIKFKNSQFEEALELYTRSLDICPVKYSSERAKILSNRGACHSQLGKRDAALSDCDEAIKLEPDYLRCLLRRADLRESAERFTEALEDYQLIIKLDPGNAKARAACSILPEKIVAQQEKLKAEMIQQLKQLGNMVLKPFGLSTENFKLTQDPNSGGYSVNFQQ